MTTDPTTPLARERHLKLKFQQMRDNPEQYFEKARKEARRKVRGQQSAICEGGIMTTDPTTLAREVVRQHGHLDRDALSRSERERLDLARAVHDLTVERDAYAKENTRLREQKDRMEALADHWESLVSSDEYESAMRNAATDLRTALNGDTDD